MPQNLTRECLSAHDQQVLDSIFNPLELTSSVTQAIGPEAHANLVDVEPVTAAVQQSKVLELCAIKLAEEDKLVEALQCFEQAIDVAPTRASVYNNRAQALRLVGRDEEALADLSKAITLCTEQPRTKCTALCQRGMLYRKQNNVDAARKDFEDAAQLGSNFAKTQLVELNPFAALCNQMLRQAFDQLK
ncbi:PREDICTED: tetratricopeptide repeat protein 36 homolog [Bactrocera latifrons]|uniref:Tetratricopeptide repeat protein 36 n=1 Tax=Bactrocera latifrons TaxID=174628 RepID=A0A0K8TVN6_BACLA|nr:PREDICTED: tetratricopeptide repeat protein 36 homolog [Bactrocera latifrons]XP_018786933.1 PREDICTED: tetratricopeptide repeat protein 36 homolog [Bactrocera latifrons]